MALPPPPEGLDIMETRTTEFLGAVISVAVLAVIAVGLRVWSRYISDAPFKWDDYLIFIALTFSCVLCGLNVAMVHYGLAKHLWNPEVKVDKVYKILWVNEFFYTNAIPAVKMSVIMSYHRIFSVHRFNIMLNLCTFIVLGWWVGVFVTTGVQCQPYSYFWRQFAEPDSGKCIDIYSFFLYNGIVEAVTDFLILAVPIPLVWKLQMQKSQKLAVMGIFLLGGFVCIAGVFRSYTTTYIARDADATWNVSYVMTWSSVEPCIGVVSACLPILRPLMRRALPNIFNRTTPSSKGYGGAPGGDSNQPGEFYRLQESNKFRSHDDEVALTTDVRNGVGASSGNVSMDKGPSSNAISVQHDISWTSKYAGK